MKFIVMAQLAADPAQWVKKAVCKERWQAEKYIVQLALFSDRFQDFRIDTETETEA